jgi:hypothetical protein
MFLTILKKQHLSSVSKHFSPIEIPFAIAFSFAAIPPSIGFRKSWMIMIFKLILAGQHHQAPREGARHPTEQGQGVQALRRHSGNSFKPRAKIFSIVFVDRCSSEPV